MSLFRKKSSDIIDFTALQKRGILEKTLTEPIKSQDNPQFPSMPDLPPQPSSGDTSPLLDMFSALDNVTLGQQPQLLKSPGLLSDSDLNSLRLKVDDLEFKLERLIEKLQAIEGKIKNQD